MQVGIYFQSTQISCVYDATQKSGTVPASLLMNVTAGEAGSLEWNNRAEVEVRENLTLGADRGNGDWFNVSFQ